MFNADGDGFKPMEFLVGSCWIGTFPDGKSTDEHCFEWVFDQKFIRSIGSGHFGEEGILFPEQRTGPDSYTVSQKARADGAWKTLWVMEFSRKK